MIEGTALLEAILATAAVLFSLSDRPPRLLTPPQAKEQIVQAFSDSDRRALAAFEKLRKKREANLHPDPDVRKQQLVWIERYKAIEGEYRRSIERLERGELVPPAQPLMPRARPEDTRSKPIRDEYRIGLIRCRLL